jgi:GNAT superfamily N-acetyltransferase
VPGIGPAGHVAIVAGASAELSRLFVVPVARRRGVAGALVTAAVSWAREQRLPLVLEVVDEGRSSAIAFYESHGWECTHTSVADWTRPDGSPVKLRHYRLAE